MTVWAGAAGWSDVCGHVLVTCGPSMPKGPLGAVEGLVGIALVMFVMGW